MEKQIIKDNRGVPVSVLIGYKDWLEIEHILENTKVIHPKLDILDNPIDWYTLTETANAILNALIAYTGREEFKELKKAVPDKQHINELHLFSDELEAMNSEPDNFKSASRMREIISKYAPQLKAIYEHE